MKNRKQKHYMPRMIGAMILAIVMVVACCVPASFAEQLPSDQIDPDGFNPKAAQSLIEDESINHLLDIMAGMPCNEEVAAEPDSAMLEYWETRGGVNTNALDCVSAVDAQMDDMTMSEYGDLLVSFDIINGTSASAAQQAIVKLTFTGDGAEEAYVGELTDADGNVVKTVKILNGEEIRFGQDQQLRVCNIKAGTDYDVNKIITSGFERLDEYGTKGKIVAGETIEAVFDEMYCTRGMVEIHATVKNKGQSLPRYQYEYQIGNLYTGELLKTAMSMEDGDINFGKIFFENLGEPSQTLLYVEPYYQLSGDIDDVNADTAFIVEVLPEDNGLGTMTFNLNYFNDSALETADVILCKFCGGTGFIGQDMQCANCKGRGVDYVLFREKPVEEMCFGADAPTPCDVVLTAQVENVGLPEGSTADMCYQLYELKDNTFVERDEVLADANGNIVFNPLTFDVDDIGQTYCFIALQVAYVDSEKIIPDDSIFGYSVVVSENEQNEVVCDVQFVDVRNFFEDCPVCGGSGFTELPDNEVYLRYMTNFADYAGFGFAQPYMLDVQTADRATGVLVADQFSELIRAIETPNQTVALDPNYEYFCNFQDGVYHDVGLLGEIYVYTSNNDEAHISVVMPTEEELNNEELFTRMSNGDFVEKNATVVKMHKLCDTCHGSGIVQSENWAPTKTDIQPVFVNYFMDASMSVAIDADADTDTVETDTEPVMIDGTENCAEAPSPIQEFADSVKESMQEAAEAIVESQLEVG